MTSVPETWDNRAAGGGSMPPPPPPLSLYSTATQNTWRRGLALGNAPDAKLLCWRYQHVGIFWRYLTLKFAFSPTPTPNASQWNIGCVGSQRKMLALAMYISCFLCRFHLRLVPNSNPISSGIWALSPPKFNFRLVTDGHSVFGLILNKYFVLLRVNY